MKKTISLLSIIFLVVLAIIILPALASSYEFIVRKNDTVTQDRIKQVSTDTEAADADFAAQLANQTVAYKTEPQLLSLYGWTTPTDNENFKAGTITYPSGEARITLGTPNSGASIQTIKAYTGSAGITLLSQGKLEGEAWGPLAYSFYDSAESIGNTSENPQNLVNLSIGLQGPLSPYYDIYYRAFRPEKGWNEWSMNTQYLFNESDESPFEAIEIRILPKPLTQVDPSIDIAEVPTIKAVANPAYDGAPIELTGKTIELGDPEQEEPIASYSLQSTDPNVGITYSAYVQNLGWEEPKADGALAGNTSRDPIEAVTMNLTGVADNYDLYYRVNVDGYGWLDWAVNGQVSGTVNQAYTIRAMELRILPKGTIAPGNGTTPLVTAYTFDEGSFLKRVNANRLDKGLTLLTGNEELHQAAEVRAQELVESYSHDRPNMKSFQTVLEDVQYRSDGLTPALGEDILDITDPVTGYLTLARDAACAKILITDYYNYFAYSTAGDSVGVLLLTDFPSLISN